MKPAGLGRRFDSGTVTQAAGEHCIRHVDFPTDRCNFCGATAQRSCQPSRVHGAAFHSPFEQRREV